MGNQETGQAEGDIAAPRPSIWARPGQGGTATLPPPAAPPQPAVPGAPPPSQPYQPFPPTPSDRRRRQAMVVATAALVIGIAAVIMAGIGVMRPTPPPVTKTVTAGPPSYSSDQIAAAKKDACQASLSINTAITAAQRAYIATLPNKESPEAKSALADFQLTVMVETQYLRTQVQPATPGDVKDATDRYVNAWLALVDADTRVIPDVDAQKFVRDVRLAGDQLDKVCE